jgi:hypothetical protein
MSVTPKAAPGAIHTIAHPLVQERLEFNALERE